MRRLLCSALILGFIVAPASRAAVDDAIAPADQPVYARPELLLLPLRGLNTKAHMPAVVDGLLVKALGGHPHVSVLSGAEVRRAIENEADLQLLGAEPAPARLAAVAAKAAADLIVFGSVARVDSFVVDLALFDARTATALRRVRVQQPDLQTLERALIEQGALLIDQALQPPVAGHDVLVARVVDSVPAAQRSGLQVLPFTVARTPFSSRFGLSTALSVQSAARGAAVPGVTTSAATMVGSYRVVADMVEVAWALPGSDVKGQARLLRASLPGGGADLVPANLEAAARDHALLAPVQLAADFQLEAFTDKGSVGVVFTQGEEFHLTVKASKPSWVRVIWHLADGTRALVEDRWEIKAADVGKPVRYAQTFDPAPPFGVERIQFVAFTDKPTPLATEKRVIDGTPYDVIVSAAEAVRHRGFVKKDKQQMAEALITLTSLPR